ncbi:MAG: hypothetical protein WBA61_07070 [Aequorivita sp.]
MAPKKMDIGKLLRKYGYAFPKNSDEVKAFEIKFSNEDYFTPKKWPDINDIIYSKENNIPVFNLKKEENNAPYNLSMAARDGKEISKEDRDQMNKDKKDAQRK